MFFGIIFPKNNLCYPRTTSFSIINTGEIENSLIIGFFIDKGEGSSSDNPELTIEYSYENIQSFEGGNL